MNRLSSRPQDPGNLIGVKRCLKPRRLVTEFSMLCDAWGRLEEALALHKKGEVVIF